MMTLSALLRILGTYAAAGLVGFLLYVASFRLPVGGEILFYRGLVLATLTALALGTVLWLARRRLRVDLATGLGAVLSSMAFNICFLVLFPVTVDRSISVFLLARIEAQQGMTTAQLQDRFASEYLVGMDQIPRRVTEQQLSGNITVDPQGRIALTERGRRFNAFARTAAEWFDTDRRFVGTEPPAKP